MLKVVTAIGGSGAIPDGIDAGSIARRFAGAPASVGRTGLVVSEVVRRMRGDLEAHAFVEQWWADGDAAAPGNVHGATFGASMTQWLTEEHVLKRPDYAAGSSRLKVIGTAYRRDDFTPQAFFDYWRTVHAPVSARVPGLGAYVVSEVLQRLTGELDADAFVEQWWPDEATLEATSDSPELAIAWADVGNYAKTTGTFWLVREHVVEAPVYAAPGLLER